MPQLFQDPQLHDLIDFVRTDLPRRMENSEFVAWLERIPVDRKQHPEFHLAEPYEEIGSFVRRGLINEKLFLQGHWYNVLLYWKPLPYRPDCSRLSA